MTEGRVVVAGLGNVLLGDDGIGPLVVSYLADGWGFPDRTELLDLGTPGLNLQPYLHDLHALVVVDAVKASRPVGSVMVLDREAILHRPLPPRVSPHDLGLVESVTLAELAQGRPIDLSLVGVVVERTEQGARMSAPVTSAADAAARAVLERLRLLGIYPEPKQRVSSKWRFDAV